MCLACNIFRQKKILLARLAGIQKALCRKHNPFLVNLESDLTEEYGVLRERETIYWKQKSREKWVKEGDRNTKFFHLTTMIRRRRNKVDGLFDANGNWCDTPSAMRTIAVDFFRNIFSGADWHDLGFCYVQHWSFKAPGFDGFPAKFFHQHWDLVADEVYSLVSQAFETGKIPDGLNHTLITLKYQRKEGIYDLED
ncbi:uncharacterized protein LOC112171680 [Rosa chinensis]|uniref:uncharacterized protein LOC112171680 n=1 Tax=Rosa chinensis TaxID=74649 RepID=UPI000D08CF10|nr:uncharacterized protein LOC112171680 [Rosa chinensis]